MALAIALGWRRFGLGGCEQRATNLQLPGTVAVGEEPDVADAVEPVRHGVQQKPPHEFIRGQRHHLELAVMSVILPGEADLAVADPNQPAVGDGDAVRVAAEIGEHLFGANGRLA